MTDYDIATDGSATDGIRNGGAAKAMLATTGDTASPVIIHSEERSTAFTSSLVEEKEAMSMAVSKLTGQGVHLF